MSPMNDATFDAIGESSKMDIDVDTNLKYPLLTPSYMESPATRLLTPPSSPERMTSRLSRQKSKARSKVMDIIKSLTASASSTSEAHTGPPLPLALPSSNHKLSMALLKGQYEPTVVHRTQFKSRPSIISLSLDRGALELTPDLSPSTSMESSKSSGKSSLPRVADSTGKTSLDSKFSLKSKGMSHNSSENRKVSAQAKVVMAEGGGGSLENPLAPIAEVEHVEDEPVPTVVTVEKAASAKIFFETYYNTANSGELTPRSIRRRQLEYALYDDFMSTSAEKENIRRLWAEQETEHLRETRVMKAQSSNALLKGKDVTSNKYEVLKVLGKGSFGVVRLVREKTEPGSEQKKEIYAMKVIRKSDMLRNSQEGHLRAERDFLVTAEGSRWVVPLIASFQDLNNLYLVMDYMPGGDFLGLLIRDNILSEAMTKWYVAEMILCIEEAHSLQWIHRDVKPDNFLVSASGHLKISDFGLAFDGHWSHDQSYFNNQRYSLLTKLGINVDGDSIDKKEGKIIATAIKAANGHGGRDRHERDSSSVADNRGLLNWRNRYGNRTLARSVVGTSQYMAPEVVKGEPYDARCDWWSVAVILYECLYGHTPFLAEEGGRQQTKINIMNHKSTFAFPSKPPVSKRCQDLIRSMIQEKSHRMCSKRYNMKDHSSFGRNKDYAGRYVYPNDAEDIKSHKWFRDIQWEHLHTMTPPFVPVIKSVEDTHYFDEEDPISDFSDSVPNTQPTVDEIADALRPFNREIQILATGFIERPHDSVKLRKVEKEIDCFNVADEQKEYLKAFVKHYGRKEKKRPRDRMLRDRDIAPKVLELRKKGAFLGYTYRRIRQSGSVSRVGYYNANPSPRKVAWHRGRLSIQ